MQPEGGQNTILRLGLNVLLLLNLFRFPSADPAAGRRAGLAKLKLTRLPEKQCR